MYALDPHRKPPTKDFGIGTIPRNGCAQCSVYRAITHLERGLVMIGAAHKRTVYIRAEIVDRGRQRESVKGGYVFCRTSRDRGIQCVIHSDDGVLARCRGGWIHLEIRDVTQR